MRTLNTLNTRYSADASHTTVPTRHTIHYWQLSERGEDVFALVVVPAPVRAVLVVVVLVVGGVERAVDRRDDRRPDDLVLELLEVHLREEGVVAHLVRAKGEGEGEGEG